MEGRVHPKGFADPKFHLSGSIILLYFIYHMSQCPSSAASAIVVLVPLFTNLFSFGISTFCHHMLNSGKQLPSFYLLLDHIAIVLHIWGASVSVSLLEATGSRNNDFIILGVTLGGIACVTYLITRPREKRERVLVIGGFGMLSLCSVPLYNAVFSNVSRVTASYVIMSLINAFGGWFYYHESIQDLGQRLPKPYSISGHSFMHLCSLIASVFFFSILVSSVCI